jgi:hypothetical protein
MPPTGFHGSCSISSRVILEVGGIFYLEARYSVVLQLQSVLAQSSAYVPPGLPSSILALVTSSKGRSGDFLELSLVPEMSVSICFRLLLTKSPTEILYVAYIPSQTISKLITMVFLNNPSMFHGL